MILSYSTVGYWEGSNAKKKQLFDDFLVEFSSLAGDGKKLH